MAELRDSERDRVPERETEGERLGVGSGLALSVREGLPVGEGDREAERDPERRPMPVSDPLQVGVPGLWLPVAVRDTEADRLSLGLRVVGVGVAEAAGLADRVAEEVPVAAGVADGVRDGLREGDGEALAGEGEGVRVWERLAVCRAEAEGVRDCDGERLCGEGVPEPVVVAVAERVFVGRGVGVREAVALPERLRVLWVREQVAEEERLLVRPGVWDSVWLKVCGGVSMAVGVGVGVHVAESEAVVPLSEALGGLEVGDGEPGAVGVRVGVGVRVSESVSLDPPESVGERVGRLGVRDALGDAVLDALPRGVGVGDEEAERDAVLALAVREPEGLAETEELPEALRLMVREAVEVRVGLREREGLCDVEEVWEGL